MTAATTWRKMPSLMIPHRNSATMSVKVIASYSSALRTSISPVRRLRPERLWEVDALRGVAIIMMVIYHLLWDLTALGGFPINVFTGFWHYFQVATASLFTGLVGVGLALRYQTMQQQRQVRYAPFFYRGAAVLSWGVVVGVVTYLFDPTMYVRWGILHLIGFSILITWPLLRFRWLNLVLAIALVVAGRVVMLLGLNIGWLDWLGLDASPRQAFDYFPVIPWLALPLFGLFLGNTLYAQGTRRFALPDIGHWTFVRLLRMMGQNSLLIYLLHQPILLLTLTVLGIISPV